MVLPAMLRVGSGDRHTFLIRVPIDDEHTWHVRYQVHLPEPGTVLPDRGVTPMGYIDIYDEDGRIIDDTVPAQDILAWIAQGPITDRTNERLGVGDVGILAFRRLLMEQLQVVEDGGEPMCVFRDPAKNQIVVLPQDRSRYPDEQMLAAAHAWDNPGNARTEAVLETGEYDIEKLAGRMYERRATHGASV